MVVLGRLGGFSPSVIEQLYCVGEGVLVTATLKNSLIDTNLV
jgi:hypothetical protein